jgi:hypothetical protein
MEDIQLVDMLETNYHVMTPHLQTIITAKKEFSELRPIPDETLSGKRGEFFNHQKFTHRYLRIYDELLVMSETGTGKSCEILGFTEWAYEELLKSENATISHTDEKLAHFRHCVILSKGPAQKKEIRMQLACKCSKPGKYDTTMVDKALKEKTQKSNLTKEINKFYTATT